MVPFYRNIARGFSYVIICLRIYTIFAGEKMKKAVLASIMVLLVFSVITQVMASTATVYPITGSYVGSALPAGHSLVNKGNVLIVTGAQGYGPVVGTLTGTMWFTLTGAIDLKTGVGSMHGKWMFIDNYGTFEGSWRADNHDVIYYEDGTGMGKGTGAYEGMVYRVERFWGYNLYLGGYVGPDGVQFEFEATILSPHGVPPY